MGWDTVSSFAVALQSIAELDCNDSPGLIKADSELGTEQALNLKYRTLLSRSADHGAVADMPGRDPASRLQNAIAALESAEFHGDIFRHLDRLRGPLPTPVTWYFHLPRTAGSKFVEDWRADGGHAFQLPVLAASRASDGAGVARALSALYSALECGAKVLIGGHVPFRAVDRFIRTTDRIHATVRHPVERALSLYRYAAAMCRSENVVGYPADATTRAHFGREWRKNVAAAGLDPDAFGLPEFMAAGMCPDNQFAEYFAQTDDAANLGPFMRAAGFAVTFQESHPRGSSVVNGTLAQATDLGDSDRRWVAALLRQDLSHFDSIGREFAG